MSQKDYDDFLNGLQQGAALPFKFVGGAAGGAGGLIGDTAGATLEGLFGPNWKLYLFGFGGLILAILILK